MGSGQAEINSLRAMQPQCGGSREGREVQNGPVWRMGTDTEAVYIGLVVQNEVRMKQGVVRRAQATFSFPGLGSDVLTPKEGCTHSCVGGFQVTDSRLCTQALWSYYAHK